MFKRSRSKDSKKSDTNENMDPLPESIDIELGDNVVIGGLDGEPISQIPPVSGHPEVKTQLSKEHGGVLLQKNMEGDLQAFYLDPRASQHLDSQYEELQSQKENSNVVFDKDMISFLREMQQEIREIKDNMSRRSSRTSSRLTSSSTTARTTKEHSPERRKGKIQENDVQAIKSNLTKGLVSQGLATKDPAPEPEKSDIRRKMQIFSKNRTMYDNLPKLESTNKSHFKKYLEDMELQFLMWNHPTDLFIPIAIQRCYSDLRSDLLGKFQEGKIKTKSDLTAIMAKLCLKGESYTGVKEKYILSNKMTESQLDFSNLYQTITSKQVEHLISLDKTLTSADHKRERKRLAVEMFKASIHPNVLAHCQSLGKADDIESLLTASNDYAQALNTKKHNLLSFEKKRVNQFSKDKDGAQGLAEIVERVMQFSAEKDQSRNPRPTQKPFWCKYCIPNKLDRRNCKHCWKHSDLSKGVLRSECSQCKYWYQKKQSAENWKDKQHVNKDIKQSQPNKNED